VGTYRQGLLGASAVKKKLIYVGDAVCATGFAEASHHYLAALQKHFEVIVVGVNYYGSPHKYPYDIYPARTPGTDWLGVRQLGNLVLSEKPDVVVIQNDPWNFPAYYEVVPPSIPIFGIVAVDGMNCNGEALNGLKGAIFWTKFGQKEAEIGGFMKPSIVAPLGVDLDLYKPADKKEARLQRGLPPRVGDGFIVGCVNRNQPRKRFDLLVSYFADWVKSCKREDAWLYIHTCPTGDTGFDVGQLMRYYGLSERNGPGKGRLMLAIPDIGFGVSKEELVNTYNCFDLMATTTQAEGWWLPGMEAMACGVPMLAPDWSAIGEWSSPAATLVECSEIACSMVTNVIGGVPDRASFVYALEKLYQDAELRASLRQKGLELVSQPQYRWENIGAKVADWVQASL
jgi:glycosyltransferase involved in cell wall biosynthesis